MSTPEHTEEQGTYARTGIVSPLGPLVDPLKTHVDFETGEIFRRLCNEAGTDVAGAMRDWVCMLVHGKTFTDIQADADKVKREKLFPKGPIAVQLTAKQS